MTNERIDTTDDTVTNGVLQEALEAYGLPKSGNKPELQARLAEAYEAVDAGRDPATTPEADDDEPKVDESVTPGGLQLGDGQALVPDMSTEVARALLKAAEDLDVDPVVIRTSSEGFLAPQEVVDKAFPNGVPDEE